jgi:hypothetical protein
MGSRTQFLQALIKLSGAWPSTCRLRGAAEGLFLATRTGTARILAHDVLDSCSLENDLSQAIVLLCYSPCISGFARRKARRSQKH